MKCLRDPLELCNTMNSNETTEQNNCENEEPTFESYGTSTVSSHTSYLSPTVSTHFQVFKMQSSSVTATNGYLLQNTQFVVQQAAVTHKYLKNCNFW